jgi:DNA polymerase alpha subunit B
VKLELRSVENEYSLFPGQIVKCVGANPTGYCFVAKEIDCYYFKQIKQEQQQQIQKTEMLLFSGPFTANDDLMYEPLDDVLHEASSKNPSIVLLMGPFVSDENINHALTSNITYKQAFEQIVMKKVEAFAKQYPNKHVVLVPSVKDAFHRYCAFPQPPFFETSKCKNVHFVANPSAFEVNGIRVAVSTCDILKHLSGFERGGKGKTTTEQQQTDRMTRLCSHMVGQMSMYPLFPPHPDAKFESHDATVPLRVGMDERVPDLIVLTSDLAAGGWKNALSGNKTMFVNPGKVCRGVNAGTFCKISSSSGENFAESARLELHKL